jgi:hypothetical protein
MRLTRSDDPIVWVRRHLKDWRLAGFRLSDLEDVKWDDPEYASRVAPIFSAKVWCHMRVDGEELHRCSPDDDAHRIAVLITKRENAHAFELLRIAADGA